MLNVGLRVVKLGKSSLMYEVGVFQEGSEQVKVSLPSHPYMSIVAGRRSCSVGEKILMCRKGATRM